MRNEKIIIYKASIAGFIQMLLFTLVSIAYNLWETDNNEALIGRILIAIIINIAGSGAIYFLFGKIYRIYWTNIQYPHLDINGLWYTLKTNPIKKDHIRIGTVNITQNYYNIHNNAETHNVVYKRYNDTVDEDMKEQTTLWEESCVLDEHGGMQGIFTATCSDGSVRKGIHIYSLEKCLKKKKPNYIEGWFIDINNNPNLETADPRKGKILLYRDKFLRDKELKKICSEYVGADNIYRTPIRNLN